MGCPRSAAAASLSSASSRGMLPVSPSPEPAIASVTSGIPRVIVPVLSSTTVVTDAARSRMSPPRMRTPFSAPLPVPTRMAVGVARPIAHGHAMMSTATALIMADERRDSAGAKHEPGDEREDGDPDHRGREPAGDGVRHACDGRLASLRVAHQAHDLLQRGLGADTRRAEPENAPVVFIVAP